MPAKPIFLDEVDAIEEAAAGDAAATRKDEIAGFGNVAIAVVGGSVRRDH